MKSKLLLCGAALLLAGCSTPPNPYASSGEISCTYDLAPQPVPDFMPADLDKLYQLPATGAEAQSSSALSQTSAGAEHGDR